jgi:DHA1 family bicyclomycin/chloramphenicol resistance-like MFS transporter
MPDHLAASATGSRPLNGSLALLILLVLFAMLGPFAMTSFVPALPAIQDSFGISSAAAQLILSLSLLATAIASLGYGGLGDRFGRRPALLSGLLIAAIGSVVAAVGDDIAWVIAGRTLQAVGAGSAYVLVRVIVGDVYGPKRSTAILGYTTAAMALAPAMAPTIGGMISDAFGWRWIFGIVAIGAFLLTAFGALQLPETAPARVIDEAEEKRPNWRALFYRPDFLRFAVSGVSAQVTFLAFVAGAPYLLIGEAPNQVSATQFGMYFAMVPIGYLSGSLIAGKRGAQLGNDLLCTIGTSLGLLCCVVMVIWTSALGVSPIAVMGPMFFGAIGAGMTMAGSQAGLVHSSPDQPGVASGVFTFIQLSASAVITQLVANLLGYGVIAMTGTMLFASVTGGIGYAVWTAKQRQQRQ